MNPRTALLAAADELVNGDRNNTYGPPDQDFRRSADAMTAYGYGKKSATGEWVGLEPHDVAIMVDCIKTSRLMWNPENRDSWVDKAGYAACGWECVQRGTNDER